MDLRNEAFIQFFANQYVRGRMFSPGVPNYWLAVDNCAFWVRLYGVLDDSGVFQHVDHFDPPFAQSDPDYLDSIVYFFKRLKQIAPDIHIIGNEGSMSDETHFAEVWAGFDGMIREDITHRFQGGGYARDDVYQAYQRSQWEASAGKTTLIRAVLPNDASFQDKLRTSYAAYLILRGPNSFFAPTYDNTNKGVPISSYQSMKNAVGTPVASASDQNYGTDWHPGYRLYSRQTSKGMLYLNWSGQELTITLPKDKVWLDRNGRTVTTLTIPDLRGDYVLFGSQAEPRVWDGSGAAPAGNCSCPVRRRRHTAR